MSAIPVDTAAAPPCAPAPAAPAPAAPAGDRPPATPERHRRALRWLLVAAVLWTLHYPRRMDRLYRAIPADAVVGSYHRELADAWRQLTRHDGLTAMLTDLGVEDAERWRADQDVYQTLFWLTGAHTVFGLRYAPGDTPRDIAVYGASYVGWKARPMEFLRLIRWIPGLGRIERTPSGTHYLVFRRSRTMRRLGLVLSLDLFEGMLVGVLSTDPDAVRELVVRARYDFNLSPVFDGAAEPWRTRPPGRHRLWISERLTDWVDPTLGPWQLDVTDLRTERIAATLRGRAPANALPPGDLAFGPGAAVAGGAVPETAPFAAFALSRALLSVAWPDGAAALPAAARGQPWGYLAGAPYPGRILGIATPTAGLVLPWTRAALTEPWVRARIERLSSSGAFALDARPSTGADGQTRFLLDAARLSPFLRTEDDDAPFVETRDGGLVIGTHLGSHLRQRADTDADAVPPFRLATMAVDRNPRAAAWCWLDLGRTYAEVRNLIALYRLATRLADGGRTAIGDATLGAIARALHAARHLRYATATLVFHEGDVELHVAAGPETR